MAGTFWKMACASAALSVAGCGPKAPPQVVAPPPPRAVPPAPVARPIPLPPSSAAPNLTIPGADAAGNRLTPNFAVGQQQALWQLRIGLNVAALNCRDANNQQLIANYTRFLTVNRSAIAAAERWVIADQGRKNSTNGIAARDALSTRLYNYFSQPPVSREFCSTAFAISSLAAAEPTSGILGFATQKLPELDQPFVNFYNAYANYQRELASWRAQQPATALGISGN